MAYSVTCPVSLMGFFAKIVNDLLTKKSMIDVLSSKYALVTGFMF